MDNYSLHIRVRTRSVIQFSKFTFGVNFGNKKNFGGFSEIMKAKV